MMVEIFKELTSLSMTVFENMADNLLIWKLIMWLINDE